MRALLALFLAVPAFAQPQPAPHDDELDWAEQVKKTVPAAEIAAAAQEAETRQSSDPLAELARKHKLEAPQWLRDRVEGQARATTVAALGDSISAATFACDFPYLFCPRQSWVVGDEPTSIKSILKAQSGRTVHGLLVSIPTVTMESVPAEAFVVWLASFFGLNVERMTLLIGHNDPGVCSPDAPGAEQTFEKNLATALRILQHVHAARGAKLFISAPVEVPTVARYGDVTPFGAQKTCREIWAETGRCKPMFSDPAGASARIAAYSAILRNAAAGRDWILYTDALNAATRGRLPDPAAILSKVDCFHPSAAGQARLGAAAWDPALASFFALPRSAAPLPELADIKAAHDDLAHR